MAEGLPDLPDIDGETLFAVFARILIHLVRRGPSIRVAAPLLLVATFLFPGSTVAADGLPGMELEWSLDLKEPGISHPVHYLFRSGPAPPPPFPDCGRDPTPDALDCAAGPRCR